MPLPTWVSADEVKPAPEPLLLVQAYLNTYEADSGVDQLADPDLAGSWLKATGLIDREAKLSSAALAQTRAIREALRGLVAANGGGVGPTQAEIRLLRDLLEVGRLRVLLSDGLHLTFAAEAVTPVDVALFRLIIVIRDAQRDGTFARLKVCSNDECRWVFYDRSHSRRGRWCDMAVCGNRLKNRALRARQTKG